MSVYQTIEDNIAGALSGISATVVTMPSNSGELARGFDNRVTVAYYGSEFGGSESTAQMVQWEEIQIAVSIEARQLRTKGGAGVYDLIRQIQKALLGFEPAQGCKRMKAKHYGKSPELFEGVWQFFLLFTTEYEAVEDFDTDSDNLAPALLREDFDAPYNSFSTAP